MPAEDTRDRESAAQSNVVMPTKNVLYSIRN